MPSLISINFKPNGAHLPYDPLKFAYQLGEECRRCHKRVIYHESISPCRCFRYSHCGCLA